MNAPLRASVTDDATHRLAAYMRLCATATPERVRTHPATTPYLSTFCAMAQQRGLLNARSWLLGRLLLDLHATPQL
jgi:hypothetical protein